MIERLYDFIIFHMRFWSPPSQPSQPWSPRCGRQHYRVGITMTSVTWRPRRLGLTANPGKSTIYRLSHFVPFCPIKISVGDFQLPCLITGGYAFRVVNFVQNKTEAHHDFLTRRDKTSLIFPGHDFLLSWWSNFPSAWSCFPRKTEGGCSKPPMVCSSALIFPTSCACRSERK